MEKRKIGSQGLSVSLVGLGCMGMSEFYGKRDDAESLATIDRALDLGVTMLDTADMYGPFKNEELVGRAIKGKRDGVVVATKFGIVRGGNPQSRGVNGRPEYVKASCDASLKRLGTDFIDLYYVHRCDPKVPIEDTVGAMSDLVRAGKVRYLGLSEPGPETIRKAHSTHPITAVQSEYSLWSRDAEDGIFQTLRELGVGFVAYSPLGRGFLTGQLRRPEDFEPDDYRRFSPRFQGENFSKNLLLADKAKELARREGITAGQLALAWVLSRGNDVVPIPGTKRRKYLEENVSAVGVNLSVKTLKELEDVFPRAAAGTRYPAEMMKFIGK